MDLSLAPWSQSQSQSQTTTTPLGLGEQWTQLSEGVVSMRWTDWEGRDHTADASQPQWHALLSRPEPMARPIPTSIPHSSYPWHLPCPIQEVMLVLVRMNLVKSRKLRKFGNGSYPQKSGKIGNGGIQDGGKSGKVRKSAAHSTRGETL